MAKSDTIYKVQNADGLFSHGGTYLRFSKTGKIWKRIGDLVNSLKLGARDYRAPTRDYLTTEEWLDQFPAGDTVVEYEIVEKRRIPVRDLMREYVPIKNQR